jgi:hypothetical protein
MIRASIGTVAKQLGDRQAIAAVGRDARIIGLG